MLNTISEAILDITNGKLVIVVDDENRENEGDFITASQNVTPEMVNFLITEARGLLCIAITEGRALELDLHPMVQNNTDAMTTNFTVSVDYRSATSTTGISTSDRAETIQAVYNQSSQANDFTRPGHIFPLIAKEGGVLTRPGHTEAAVDLARLSGRGDSGILIEILNSDGTMARLPQLLIVAEKHNIKIISIADLIDYRKSNNY
jgi:3,4-dihydroxy 2-butanone 4-phosphate synthase / GTP cyclohydrolase II